MSSSSNSWRTLGIQLCGSAQDALNLLFLGDTNRVVAVMGPSP